MILLSQVRPSEELVQKPGRQMTAFLFFFNLVHVGDMLELRFLAQTRQLTADVLFLLCVLVALAEHGAHPVVAVWANMCVDSCMFPVFVQ